MNPFICALIFVVATLYDVFYIWMVYFAQRNKAIWAAHMSILAGVCSYLGWFHSINEWKYAIFMLAGWWMGTYIGVKLNIGQSNLSPDS